MRVYMVVSYLVDVIRVTKGIYTISRFLQKDKSAFMAPSN